MHQTGQAKDNSPPTGATATSAAPSSKSTAIKVNIPAGTGYATQYPGHHNAAVRDLRSWEGHPTKHHDGDIFTPEDFGQQMLKNGFCWIKLPSITQVGEDNVKAAQALVDGFESSVPQTSHLEKVAEQSVASV